MKIKRTQVKKAAPESPAEQALRKAASSGHPCNVRQFSKQTNNLYDLNSKRQAHVDVRVTNLHR